MVPFYITIVIQFHIRKGGNAMGTIIGEGITFDDVLLVPAYSKVIPNQVDVTTYLTKKVKLNIPMMSARICLLKLRLKR